MSTYELDDELVREALTQSSKSHAARDLVLSALERQLPIPAPTQIGAIVRTDHPNPDHPVFVRWAFDSRTHSPWILLGNHEQPYRTDEIGRITEVLSEGVDL
jgi:hypothetical protein